jgi:adenosylmethionine-8-amino-7-oxononanoate aminotransferase
MGCVPAPSGYLKALKDVCHRHGALFIADEIMCGMGRTGTWHAYQQDVKGSDPDILVLGKGLGAGVQPISAMLIGQRIVDALETGSQTFVHGHTFQNHPLACAAALEALKIIAEDDLLANVVRIDNLLQELLPKKLGHLPHVGNIRGRGAFWGVSVTESCAGTESNHYQIEFVKDKTTKAPFSPDLHVAAGIQKRGQ